MRTIKFKFKKKQKEEKKYEPPSTAFLNPMPMWMKVPMLDQEAPVEALRIIAEQLIILNHNLEKR
jgi:hypothetical protein